MNTPNQSDEGAYAWIAAAGGETSQSVVLCSVFNKKETWLNWTDNISHFYSI